MVDRGAAGCEELQDGVPLITEDELVVAVGVRAGLPGPAGALARQVLYDDFSRSGPDSDNLLEMWAQPLAPLEVEGGLMEVQLRDLHRCFNLNSLAGAEAQDNHARFKTLLRNLSIPETFADSWLDWVDPDQEIAGFGAEDGEYLLRDPGYRAANRLAAHVSELKLIRDMSTEYYEALREHVCVLPSDQLRLNINTADAMPLAALAPSVNPQQMQALVEAERAYTQVAEITNEYPDLAAAEASLTVKSEYFELQVRALVDESQVELASVLHRNANDGSITLIGRDWGKDFRAMLRVYVEDG